MGKMKKTGALVLLCLLMVPLAAGALSTVKSDDPVEQPTSDLVETTEREQTEAALEAEKLPTDSYSAADRPQSAPPTAVTDPAETTEEIKVGGYVGMHTASEEELTDSVPTQVPATPEVPETGTAESDGTEASDTAGDVAAEASITVPTEAEPAETEAAVTEPVETEPVETEPEITIPTEAPVVSPATSEGQGGLYDIADPDPNYVYRVVEVTGSDRDLLERLVMGEAGDQGYIGAAMVAQCIKDAMTYQGYQSVAAVRSGMKYSGSLSKTPNEDVKKAVAYIFDEGGYAVQHPMLYFYYSRNGIKNGFHETQEFVVQYKDHRFFCKK